MVHYLSRSLQYAVLYAILKRCIFPFQANALKGEEKTVPYMIMILKKTRYNFSPMRKKIVIFLLFLAGAAALMAAPPETDSVLAAVNGDPITLGEILPTVRDREFQLRSAYSGKALEDEILKLRHKMVEELIDRRLIVADFHSQQLTIPDQDVENELDRWGTYIGCHSRRELEERVRKSGSTLAKMRERILDRMIVQVMRRREYLLAGPPSPAEIYKRFKAEEKNLAFKGSVELALLKLPKENREIIKNISVSLKKDPASWSKFVSTFAISPDTDGSIGSVELDKLRSEFATAMKDIKVNNIYHEVETADGVYFIKVLNFQTPRPAHFKEHAEGIRKKMEDEIYNQSSADYAKRLRDRAVIEYFFPVPEGVKKK